MNVIGRGWLFCIALLPFILAGSGMVHASAQPGEDVRIDPTNDDLSVGYYLIQKYRRRDVP